MGRLDGKVAVVSGGARGQGEAEVRAFIDEGAQVVFGDVLDDEGEKVAADLGDAAVYQHLDVTSEADWEAIVAAPRSTGSAARRAREQRRASCTSGSSTATRSTTTSRS